MMPEQAGPDAPAASVIDDGAVAQSPSGLDDVAAAATVEATARLYGEPLLRMPNDLYIPPDALEIFLDAFEGPLDLLLYLIRKQNFNILDIPMAQVTLQYLEYVEQIRKSNLELAAEYLLMAAMLIEIKSRMLLPKRQDDLIEDVGDPRAELVRRLLEYEQIKVAALQVGALPQEGRDFTRPQLFVEQGMAPVFPDVDPWDLQRAWLDVMRRAKLTQHHRISRQELSVREHMSAILRTLQSQRFVEFSELFAGQHTVPILSLIHI